MGIGDSEGANPSDVDTHCDMDLRKLWVENKRVVQVRPWASGVAGILETVTFRPF
jgi:hypothetical protein